MSTNYWTQWDPTNKKWIYSTDQGGSWNDLVERPTVEVITANGISAPSGVSSKGVIYYDSTANKFKVSENNGTFHFLDLDINWLTADTAPDMAADYIPIYDNSASAIKKTLACKINRVEQHGGVLWNPNGITAAANAIVWYAPYPVTITEARFRREDGSSSSVTVNMQKNGSDICSSDVTLTSSATWYTGTLSVTTMAAGDYLNIDLATVAGSPTKIMFFLTVERTG